MKVTRFDTRRDLIVLEGRIWGPRMDTQRMLRLVLDTGAAETVIVPEVLDELGYSPRQGEAITVMRSAVGREEGEVTVPEGVMVAPAIYLTHRRRDVWGDPEASGPSAFSSARPTRTSSTPSTAGRAGASGCPSRSTRCASCSPGCSTARRSGSRPLPRSVDRVAA